MNERLKRMMSELKKQANGNGEDVDDWTDDGTHVGLYGIFDLVKALEAADGKILEESQPVDRSGEPVDPP